jgi:uncharacterized protein YgiM (DUF1202 family)
MNLAMRAVVAALMTGLPVVCAAAKPIVTTGDTNLRKARGTDSEVLGLVPRGTTVEVGTCSNGWCEVSWNGRDGYMIGRNLGMSVALPRSPRVPAVAPAAVEPSPTAASEAPSAAYSGPHLGLRYTGPYDERIVVGPSGLVAGTDPDPNIRAYLRRDSGGASTTSGGMGN